MWSLQFLHCWQTGCKGAAGDILVSETTQQMSEILNGCAEQKTPHLPHYLKQIGEKQHSTAETSQDLGLRLREHHRRHQKNGRARGWVL